MYVAKLQCYLCDAVANLCILIITKKNLANKLLHSNYFPNWKNLPTCIISTIFWIPNLVFFWICTIFLTNCQKKIEWKQIIQKFFKKTEMNAINTGFNFLSTKLLSFKNYLRQFLLIHRHASLLSFVYFFSIPKQKSSHFYWWNDWITSKLSIYSKSMQFDEIFFIFKITKTTQEFWKVSIEWYF